MSNDGYLNVYLENEDVEKNPFIEAEPDFTPVPTYDEIKDKLPRPVWDGHEKEIECYDFAWKTAFSNIYAPSKENGFVSPYIDAAFNDDIFMWDSCFMLMFGRYGANVFNFQRTLDDFYCKQHPDGFICRQIHESNGGDVFYRHDPVSTGPNILAWTEWLYYRNFGDKKRLSEVYFPLLAYHKWTKTYRTWPDGSYWSTGWGCGMDNQPRISEKDFPGYYDWELESFFHGFNSWVDANLQAALSCKVLIDMADELGIDDGVDELKTEYEHLMKYINEKMWCDEDKFYHDRKPDGSLVEAKSIGAYWALISKAISDDKLDDFVAHLKNENEFKTPHGIPSLSKDHPDYSEDGNYWQGGVWPPTNYMVVKGLTENGCNDLAYSIAKNHYENVLEVYKETGTLWENYSPEYAKPGNPSRPEFVGWTGITAITTLIEYILGIRVDAHKNEIVWYVHNLEKHGIEKLYIGGEDYITLICEKRRSADEKPNITAESTRNMKIRIVYEGGEFVL